MLPQSLNLRLRNFSWSQTSTGQAYVLAEADDALYVSFLGTKRQGDLLTSFDLRGHAAFPLTVPAGRVHSGYWKRAESVPVERLYYLASLNGKRIVFVGHRFVIYIPQFKKKLTDFFY